MHDLQLITPTSHLFKNESVASSIISVSDGLELRERMLPYYVKYRWDNVKLAHLDNVDITHPWNKKRKENIIEIVSILPKLELITFHMACNCSSPRIVNNKYYPGGMVFNREELSNNAYNNIQWINDCFGANINIAIENNNYYQTPAYNIITDADFISDIVRENSIYLLFDVSHAHVTAHNKGISFEEYVGELPLESVIQIHMCKHGYLDDGSAFDLHEIPDETLVKYVLDFSDNYSVQYLTIEYYRNPNTLIDMIKKIRASRNEVVTHGK